MLGIAFQSNRLYLDVSRSNSRLRRLCFPQDQRSLASAQRRQLLWRVAQSVCRRWTDLCDRLCENIKRKPSLVLRIDFDRDSRARLELRDREAWDHALRLGLIGWQVLWTHFQQKADYRIVVDRRSGIPDAQDGRLRGCTIFEIRAGHSSHELAHPHKHDNSDANSKYNWQDDAKRNQGVQLSWHGRLLLVMQKRHETEPRLVLLQGYTARKLHHVELWCRS